MSSQIKDFWNVMPQHSYDTIKMKPVILPDVRTYLQNNMVHTLEHPDL